MALTKTSSYAGAASAEYIRRTFSGATSLMDNVFVVKERISRPWAIRRLQSTGLIQDADCDATDAGDIDIDERILTTADIQVAQTLCKDSFKGDWDEELMGAGAMGKSMPKSVTDGMIGEIGDAVGEDLERQLWEGDTGGTDQFDGVVTLLLADSENTEIAGTLAEYAGAPIATLSKIRADAIANKIAALPNTVFVMSVTNLQLYQDDLRTAGSGQENISGEVASSFNGTPIVASYGILDNHILIVNKDQLYFGTDLSSDANSVAIIDKTPLDGSQNVKYVLRTTAGVQYAWGGEISFYNEALV